jgi:2-keto-3-deoxy-L-fuconate dehydrogenase
VTDRLQGKRILVTQAEDFMGPVICEMLAEHGAEVPLGRGRRSEE